MGKDRLIRYVIRDDNARTLSAWDTATHGRPTVQNLIRWRDGYNLSLCKGGANDHIGIAGWIQRKIHVYDQYHGRRIVEYNPPMFEAIPNTPTAATARRVMGLYNKPQTATV